MASLGGELWGVRGEKWWREDPSGDKRAWGSLRYRRVQSTYLCTRYIP